MMRVSMREDDPGYSPYAAGTKVFCNGVELRMCFTADEELGYALVYSPDKDGKAHLLPGSDEIAVGTVRGVIRVEPSPALAAHLRHNE